MLNKIIALAAIFALSCTSNNSVINKPPNIHQKCFENPPPEDNGVFVIGLQDGVLGVEFNSDIYAGSYLKLHYILQLAAIDDNVSGVFIHLKSNGGSVEHGMNIIKDIITLNKPVGCFVTEEAASMGFYIFEACDMRIMTTEATLLAHEPKVDVPSLYLDQYDLLEKYNSVKNIANILAKIAVAKMGIDIRLFEAKVKHQDWIMSAENALLFNAVDQIVETVEE